MQHHHIHHPPSEALKDTQACLLELFFRILVISFQVVGLRGQTSGISGLRGSSQRAFGSPGLACGFMCLRGYLADCCVMLPTTLPCFRERFCKSIGNARLGISLQFLHCIRGRKTSNVTEHVEINSFAWFPPQYPPWSSRRAGCSSWSLPHRAFRCARRNLLVLAHKLRLGFAMTLLISWQGRVICERMLSSCNPILFVKTLRSSIAKNVP